MKLKVESICILSVLLLLVLAVGFNGAQSPKKFVNIDYIGLGYDILKGNPHMIDPGFRRAVVNLSYSEQRHSADGVWLIPDNIQALPSVSCDYSVDSDEVTNTSSYENSLSQDSSVSFGFLGFFKFSHSKGYKEVNEGLTLNNKNYVESTARCTVYNTRIKSAGGLKVTSEFVDAIERLPTTRNEQIYNYFIKAFGTHFASEIVMGAKQVIQSEFDKNVWSQMKSKSYSFKTGAQLSFFGFKIGGSSSHSTSNAIKNEYESKRSSYRSVYMGSHPPQDGKWETWVKTCADNPYPVSYSLLPIAELLTIKYIAGHNESNLKEKRQLLTEAVDKYCRGPLQMEKMSTTITATGNVWCRAGYSLLSCGILNSQAWRLDPSRYSSPISSTACTCRDAYGLTCVAWCANHVVGFQIVTVSLTTHTFTVSSCPSGKKLIGCHIQLPNNFYNKFYPTNETSCTCYTMGSTGSCVASCASNVKNHEIKTTMVTGSGDVFCTGSNVVLGCGINPSSASEQFRAVHVPAKNYCNCYDRYGATCYAICGQL